MASSDALVVVEDWISEHYFTSVARNETFHARVRARRASWDEYEGASSVRSRFTQYRARLEAGLAALYDPSATRTASTPDLLDLYELVQTILGYRSGEFAIRKEGPVRFFATPGVDAEPLVLVAAQPVATLDEIGDRTSDTLVEPYLSRDDEKITSTAVLLSRLFVEADGPTFALVQSGRWLVIADRDRWPEGRYLGIDLQLVSERNETKRAGEIDTALTCVAAESLAPDADGEIWWTEVLEDSVKHTVGVSKDLREGVRRSIEIIANEVVARREQQALPPLSPDLAQPLAVQSLRFLYRILFLLYAEASPELGVLPVKAPEYTQGYSLDRLRELIQVDLATERGRRGTHLFASLGRLFALVDQGHAVQRSATDDPDAESEALSLRFNALRADLFQQTATSMIDEVGLGNQALQDVLQRLLLSKRTAGKERGFISYVDLGINQLGAVYEGLMSYTGSFAEQDLHEVAKGGDSEKGSWVVPVDRVAGLAAADFVTDEDPLTGERTPVVHRRGTFVFRLSGRERQLSASYYTPEVLTRFTIGQALAELLDQDGTITSADEILDLSVCEPALGSGAFAIEAVRQLAEEYLRRRQAELGRSISPENYQAELQCVKAYIALHQVYGVDLNATALELAEVSLWLDTMAPDLAAPWFGLRLRRGNSLIGARHAVYSRAQVNDKSWVVAPPTDVPLADLAAAVDRDEPVSSTDGRILHFLLPAAGWGATSEAKEARELSPSATEVVKQWRKAFKVRPTRAQLDQLVEISRRVEVLWQVAFRRLRVAEAESRRDIPLWGRETAEHGSRVTREQIEESLNNPDGAYRRLRLIMDAWCALWFWPLHGQQAETATRIAPPTLDQWISALQSIVGRDPQRLRKAGMGTFGAGSDWAALAEAERADLEFAQALPVASVLEEQPWLRTCVEVAERQAFFHWELDFAPLFARGGFDLQAGNPPWVRPRLDMDEIFLEFDTARSWSRANEGPRSLRDAYNDLNTSARALVCEAIFDTRSVSNYLSAESNFPVLSGLQPDLYRCFMMRTWGHSSSTGVVALLHPDTHFTDERGGHLRTETYRRLRRHWLFTNQLRYFDIGNTRPFGVHVYGSHTSNVRFLNGSGFLNPETVIGSLRHDGSGEAPGIKHLDGSWDLRPHRSRIALVTDNTLREWTQILDDSSPPAAAKMVYTANAELAIVQAQMLKRRRLSQLQLTFSQGMNEKSELKAGTIVKKWGAVSTWSEAILQGPHMHVANPLYKRPNRLMRSHRDWSPIDLEDFDETLPPVTSFKFVRPRAVSQNQSAGYRLAWRCMADPNRDRTLLAAIYPIEASHTDSVMSAESLGDVLSLAFGGALLTSLLADFSIRSVLKSTIRAGQINRLPMIDQHALSNIVLHRFLRLVCLEPRYADLWERCYVDEFASDSWCSTKENIGQLASPSPRWTDRIPMTSDLARRQAIVELDSAVAIILGVSADQLCTVYRTQFPVLYAYDKKRYLYDYSGRLVPTTVSKSWLEKGAAIPDEDRTRTDEHGRNYLYEMPFSLYDREADMRSAYAEFERRLAER